MGLGKQRKKHFFITGAYLGPSLKCLRWSFFTKIINGFLPQTSHFVPRADEVGELDLQKRFSIDVWQGPYTDCIIYASFFCIKKKYHFLAEITEYIFSFNWNNKCFKPDFMTDRQLTTHCFFLMKNLLLKLFLHQRHIHVRLSRPFDTMTKEKMKKECYTFWRAFMILKNISFAKDII